jgi:hypothetical protein
MSNTTIKHTKLSVVALVMSTAFLLPGVAGAADEICKVKLAEVETAILDGDFLGKFGYRDESNMLNKHYQARVKLRRGKFDNAIDKLINISDKAYDLASAFPKSKLSDVSEAAISMAVNDAIDCIAPPAP